MKKITVVALCFLISSISFAGTKTNCKKKYREVSCSEVESAKRESFCWKGKLPEAKKVKICTSEKRKKNKMKGKRKNKK